MTFVRLQPLMMLAAAVVAAGCTRDAPLLGPTVVGEPSTRYYFLDAPLRFQATDLGFVPEVEFFGGGLWWMPFEECEIRPEGLKVWPHPYVTVRYEGDRPAEIGLWMSGVICRRYEFGYDGDGRLASRVETQYKGRRPDEPEDEWVARTHGTVPAVTFVSELGYAWSPDGRAATVFLCAARGIPDGGSYWPDTPGGYPGGVLETWRLDARGRIVEVHRQGWQVYSATYDESGRLVCYDRNSERGEIRRDARGRPMETRVQTGRGCYLILLHEHPESPAPELRLPADPSGCETYTVTHDESGLVIRAETETKGDILASVGTRLKRDAQGRVRTMTVMLIQPWWFRLFQGRYVFE